MKEERMMNQNSCYCKQKETQKVVTTIKSLKYLMIIMLSCSVLFTTGCTGLLLRHVEKGNDKTYAELKDSIQQITPTSGRLFIYLVDGGPNLFNTGGLMYDYCTVDEHIYKIMGKTYWYIDLLPGKHKVTVGGGKNKIVEFDIAEGQTIYCRINLSFGFPYSLSPVIIEPKEAEQELLGLDWYKNFQKGKGM
jgi:hypothetical protein